MPTLTAVLAADQFVEGAEKMADSVKYLFNALDNSFRAMQKFETTLSTFSGSLDNAKIDLSTLFDTANDLGISFESAAAPFAKFASAAEGLTRSQIFGIFDSFATTLSAVRANGSEVNGVFLALQQIVSKGKLSMEELRLQLAERIPGAMKLAAQAAGMNMTEFEESVRKGTINTSKWLLDFSNLLEEKFGSAAALAAKTFDAEVNRLKNSFLKFNASIVQNSGSADVWAEILRSINDEFLNNEEVINKASRAVIDISNSTKDLFNILLTGKSIIDVLTTSIDILARGFALTSGSVNMFAAAMSGMRTGLLEAKLSWYEFLDIFKDSDDVMINLQQRIQASKEASADFAIKSAEAFQRMSEPFDNIISKTNEYNDALNNTSNTILTQIQELDNITKSIGESLVEDVKAHEKANNEKEKAIYDMYKNAGLGADAYYDLEAQKLVEQVSNWQKNGADIYQSNEWLYSQIGSLAEEAFSKGEIAAAQTLTQYQNMSNTIVEQFNNAQKTVADTLEEMSKQVEGLDGSKINITASLDGGYVIAGIDNLISKFNQLRSAASTTYQASTSFDSEGSESWDDFLERQNSNNYQNPNGSSTINNFNFNQDISRSDANNIVRETNRLSDRS